MCIRETCLCSQIRLTLHIHYSSKHYYSLVFKQYSSNPESLILLQFCLTRITLNRRSHNRVLLYLALRYIEEEPLTSTNLSIAYITFLWGDAVYLNVLHTKKK